MFCAGANKPGEDFQVHKSINICLNEKKRGRKNAKKKKHLTSVIGLFLLFKYLQPAMLAGSARNIKRLRKGEH